MGAETIKCEGTGNQDARAAIQRVLIVEDSRMQRIFFAGVLSRWGYDVMEATSGEEALRICHSHRPDLIISDWLMPGLSGLDFCRKFRQIACEHYVYFILLTSKSDSQDIALGLDAGADDFLSKPVSTDELRARIGAAERILAMHKQLQEQTRVASQSLRELKELYAVIDKDLLQAKKLQQALVRDTYRSFGLTDVSLLLRPSGHVGGDLVGSFAIGEGMCALYGIDVSGHGITPALLAARLNGYLSGSVPELNVALLNTPDAQVVARPPDKTLGLLNRVALTDMSDDHFFTLMLAIVDLRTGRVSAAQGGHPPLVIQRADGRIEHHGEGGLPLGLFESATYKSFEAQLFAGDRLFVMSDGVTECPNPDGELFENNRVREFLENHVSLKGPAVLENLVDELQRYFQGETLPDDVSLGMLEYTK